MAEFVCVNAAYAAILAAFMAAGALLGMPSLQASGTTFLFLYASEKAWELAYQVKDARALWVLGFAASVAMWRVGLFLSSHPGWLASVIGVGDGLLPPPQGTQAA
jgi:hypothetical protein